MIYTGNRRANQYQDACRLAAAQGYRIDATLKQPIQLPDGRTTNGWCDIDHRIIWLHVPATLTDKALHKLMLHEAGHARFFNRSYPHRWWRRVRGLPADRFTRRDVSEDFAETYAWSRLTATQRDRLGFMFKGRYPPTAAQITAART